MELETIAMYVALRYGGRLGFLILVSTVATMVAPAICFLLLLTIALFINPIYLLLTWPSILTSLKIWTLDAVPITFGLLPLATILIGNRPLILQLALPVIGLLGGILTMSFGPDLAPTYFERSYGAVVILGAIGGFAAGALYGHLMAEAPK